MRAGVAADAGEAMLQHAAGEKLVSDLGAAGAASGMRAPGPRSAEHTPTDRAACHRSAARRDVLTQHPRGAGLVVSHDGAFMDAVCTNILHVEAKSSESYKGNYSQFVTQCQ